MESEWQLTSIQVMVPSGGAEEAVGSLLCSNRTIFARDTTIIFF